MSQEQPTIQSTDLDIYINSLLEQAGLLDLEESKLKDIKERLSNKFQETLGTEAIKMLSDSGQREYFEFLENPQMPDSDSIQNFFIAHVENFQEKINKVVQDFTDNFLKNFEE